MYGLLFLIVLTLLVHALATIPFIHELRLSPMVLGVVVGMILANTLRPRLPESWDGGLKIASKQLLRAGIVLYGFRLTYDTEEELSSSTSSSSSGHSSSATTSAVPWAWIRTSVYSSLRARPSAEPLQSSRPNPSSEPSRTRRQ